MEESLLSYTSGHPLAQILSGICSSPSKWIEHISIPYYLVCSILFGLDFSIVGLRYLYGLLAIGPAIFMGLTNRQCGGVALILQREDGFTILVLHYCCWLPNREKCFLVNFLCPSSVSILQVFPGLSCHCDGSRYPFDHTKTYGKLILKICNSK